MKIRTDFVTNSSSSNYVTINIKSSKLTEIICAARICKESGVSNNYHWGCIDKLNIDESEHMVTLLLEISNIISRGDEDMEQTDEEDTEQMNKPDLEYIGYPPEHVSGLSKSLLRLLKEAGERRQYQRGYDLEKICSALEKHGDAILADTETADWIYDTEGHGEAGLFTWFWILSKYIAKKENLDYFPPYAELSRSFHYDREHGESTKEEYRYSEPYEKEFTDDDWDMEAGFEGYDEDDWPIDDD